MFIDHIPCSRHWRKSNEQNRYGSCLCGAGSLVREADKKINKKNV